MSIATALKASYHHHSDATYMPSSKRNKSKKSTPVTPADTLPPQASVADDELVDDLFAALDSRDQPSQQAEPPENKPEEGVESGSKKRSSKVRHLARQVGMAWSATQDSVHSKVRVGTKGSFASSELYSFRSRPRCTAGS